MNKSLYIIMEEDWFNLGQIADGAIFQLIAFNHLDLQKKYWKALHHKSYERMPFCPNQFRQQEKMRKVPFFN